MRYLFILFLILFASSSMAQESSLTGKWEGDIKLPNGAELKIVINFSENNQGLSGSLDIPQQNAIGLRFSQISIIEDSVSFSFEAGQTTGTFTGKMESETVITGNYTQGGPSFPFGIIRTGEAEKIKTAENEESIVIQVNDVQIGGTLTLPTEIKSDALVIMSSGSGAQDRDETIFEFKVFEVIAQHLASQGIASYRYDDRGIGDSSGNFAASGVDELSSDVEGIINYFKSTDQNSFQGFILFGHSQGGIIAGNVAARNPDVKQVILMASPVPPLSEILRYQAELAYAPIGMDEDIVNTELDAREGLMLATQKGGDVNAAEETYKAAYRLLVDNLPPMQRMGIHDIDEFVENQAIALRASYESPALGSFLFYDSSDDLTKLKVPVLGLFGEKDTQVNLELNKEPLENALTESGTQHEVVVFPEANHLFQKANTGLINEYGNLDKVFVDGFLEKISSWILAN